MSQHVEWSRKEKILAAVVVFLGLFFVYRGFADQDQYGSQAAANFTRACSFESQTAQLVPISSTASRTSSNVGYGQVRIVCNQNAHFFQGANGVAGPTAVTGDSYLPLGSPEYVIGTNGKISFIRDSADGFCYVTACK